MLRVEDVGQCSLRIVGLRLRVYSFTYRRIELGVCSFGKSFMDYAVQ